MVKKLDELLLKKEAIPEEVMEEQLKKEDTSKLNIFFSFDIINSTKYKNLDDKWPIVLKNLLDRIRKRVATSEIYTIATSILWRVIGDELIFISTVSKHDRLTKIVREIFEITQEESLNIRKEDPKALLDIKAAAWIAVVINASEVKHKNIYDNISYNYGATFYNQVIRDYLGKDIDAGFRLKYYTQGRRLVISFELAYFLLEEEDIQHLYIMDYVKLKGVWNESLYPIIWYDNEDKRTFINSFKYDELVNNPIIEHFLYRQTKYRFSHIKEQTIINIFNTIPKADMIVLSDDMYKPYKALKKICIDKNLNNKINYMRTLLNNRETREDLPNPLELHCAVVCCDVVNRKVFIVRRTKNHESNANRWEFGCAKASGNEKLVQSIKHYYEETFGISLELVMDKNRTDMQPKPLALYEIEKSRGEVKKGIILVGKIISPINNCYIKDKEEHSEIKFIGENELNKFSSNEVISDFYNTAKLVFENFNKFFTV